MPNSGMASSVVRFEAFEVDLRAGELHKDGRRIKIQEQPFRILSLLLERSGELVTREELRQNLWPADTFVDFNQGLNSAVARLREALRDSAEKPRYIETIAKRGYRFISPLDGFAASLPTSHPVASPSDAQSAQDKPLVGNHAARRILATLQKFDVPLAEATTSSLEALQAFSMARKVSTEKGVYASLPYLERAIQLDPNFATGYGAIANAYWGMGEVGRASEYYTKAFELREHASEREKLLITGRYYQNVTGELDKAEQAYQQLIETYPRYYIGHADLSQVYSAQGKYEKALEAIHHAQQLAPDRIGPYEALANYRISLQRLNEARQTIRETQERKFDDFLFHNVLYGMAFLTADSSALRQEQQWFADHPGVEHFGLSLDSDGNAYAGHLGKAREQTKQAVDSAIRADSKEAGAIWWENAALREAAFGDYGEAKQAVAEGLKLYPGSQGVQVEAALASAMASDSARTTSLAQALKQRYPLDTQLQSLWLPATQAQVALNRKAAAEAIEHLKLASPIEFGQIPFISQISCLYPTYIRGQAYLAAGEGKEAAAEFQKVLDHSGLVWNCWTGALAGLGVARANALLAKNSTGADADAAQVRALAAYKDFLTLWKDADPDIPIYKQAKAEYAKLN